MPRLFLKNVLTRVSLLLRSFACLSMMYSGTEVVQCVHLNHQVVYPCLSHYLARLYTSQVGQDFFHQQYKPPNLNQKKRTPAADFGRKPKDLAQGVFLRSGALSLGNNKNMCIEWCSMVFPGISWFFPVLLIGLKPPTRYCLWLHMCTFKVAMGEFSRSSGVNEIKHLLDAVRFGSEMSWIVHEDVRNMLISNDRAILFFKKALPRWKLFLIYNDNCIQYVIILHNMPSNDENN